MARIVKIVLMFSISLWGLTGFMSNMLDFSHGWGQVKFVVSMAGEGANEAPGMEWRSVTSPTILAILSTLGFAFIYVSKLLTGVLCMYCGVQMFRARKADAETFNAAKEWGVLGCGISVVMLFLGFVVITGHYFEYWRVPIFGIVALEFAFLYLLSLMSFLLYLQSPEKQPN
jgi:predicted small integral membrane protein